MRLYFVHDRRAYRHVHIAEHLDTTANISGWFKEVHWDSILHVEKLSAFHRFEFSMNKDPNIKDKSMNEVITSNICTCFF